MRWLEDVGFLAAILIALLYGSAESLRVLGWCRGGPCATDHPFPWGLLIICGCLVVPKTVGRVTAGRIWQAIANRVGGTAGGDKAP